ncbi:MAG: NAD-dependent deacylase [Victivallales bacterium]|nr:NAD-dependent deacylase [Victivallales bacterium]MBR5838196.1 NAD-dependent deacylase [Victivallales bacterium]
MEKAEKIKSFSEILRKASRIAVLSGAGMSTESGIPDFRSSNGLYSYTSEEVFDLGNFLRKPESFYEIIAPLYDSIMKSEPNAGHLALHELEEKYGKTVVVATQNIDGLHQKAGSRIVHELHGGMLSLTCQKCGGQVPASALDAQLRSGKVVRHEPTCMGVMKPDIVFYGEMLPQDALMKSYKAMTQADLVLVLGTSLAVYPAAGLPTERSRDAELVIINRTPTPLDGEATLVFHESIGEILPAAVKGI